MGRPYAPLEYRRDAGVPLPGDQDIRMRRSDPAGTGSDPASGGRKGIKKKTFREKERFKGERRKFILQEEDELLRGKKNNFPEKYPR